MRTFLLLSLIIIVCGAGILLWHRADTLPPHQDEARQLRASIHYLDDLNHPLGERISRLAFSRYETYPPAVYITTLPLYLVWGPGKDVAGAVNAIFIAILVLSVYGIGRRLYSGTVGLAAAAIAAGYPIIVGLSRLYVLEIPETAMVSLAVYAALRTDGFRKTSRCIVLGAVCGVGMLVKWHFCLFCAAPILYILISPGRSILLSVPPGKRIFNLSFCLAAALLIAGPWYTANYSAAMGFVLRNLGDRYSAAAPPLFSLGSFLFFPYALADTMLLVPMLLLFLAGLGIAVRHKKASLVLVLWIAVPLAVMVAVRQKLPRYFTPALPAIALLTAAGFSLVKTVTLRRALYSVAFAISAANFILLTFPPPPGGIDVSFDLPFYDRSYDAWFPLKAHVVRTELPSYGMGPPRREEWRIEEILDDVASLGRGSEQRSVSLGWFIYPHIRFHRYVLYYLIDLHGHPIRCVPPDRAQYLLTRLTTEEHKRRLAEWSRPWLHLEEMKRYPLPDGSEAVLYRTTLTRRRRYRAHELPLDTGERRVADSRSSDGWARYADRSGSPPGAVVKGLSHPLDGGGYRLTLKVKYDRPADKGSLGVLEVGSGTGGEPLASRELGVEALGEPGKYGCASLDFTLPGRDRAVIRLLHTGRADLWIDTLLITPLGDNR